MNDLATAQYTTYVNNIVGTWYNNMPDEMLVFSFLYNNTQDSDMLIRERGVCLETTYSIQNVLEDRWLLVVWNEQDNVTVFYNIEALSPDKLVLTTEKRELKVYSRNTGDDFLYHTYEKESHQ